MSPKVQNEIIELIAAQVKQKISLEAQNRPFSIIGKFILALKRNENKFYEKNDFLSRRIDGHL